MLNKFEGYIILGVVTFIANRISDSIMIQNFIKNMKLQLNPNAYFIWICTSEPNIKFLRRVGGLGKAQKENLEKEQEDE